MRITLTAASFAMLVWGAFFLELAVFLALGLLMILVVLARTLIYQDNKIDKLAFLILANMMMWLASGFAVGAIGISAFWNPGFYLSDGRIFIAMLPLLVLCFATVSSFDLKFLIKNLYVMGGVSVLIWTFWYVTKVPFLAGAVHADEYHGFLTSHSGAGTFFGAMAVFMVLYQAERRHLPLLISAFVLFGPMISTGSRQSMISALMTLCWYWFIKRKNPQALAAVAVAIALIFPVMSSFSEKTYNRNVNIFSVDTAVAIREQVKSGWRTDWAVGDWSLSSDNSKLQEGDMTTLARIMLWVYGTKLFLENPLFGVGWGRFNDRYLFITDTDFFGLAVDGKVVFNTATAHNTYFHMLAESGLVGTVFFLLIFVILFLRVRKAETIFKPFRTERAYYVACQGLTIYVLFCGLTDHALAAPSLMMPFTVILGFGIAHYRHVIKIHTPSHSIAWTKGQAP